MDQTSASLLERLRQPTDQEAWNRFVALYTPLLFFWSCRMGLQAQDSADLVQDVFTTVLEQLPTFQLDPNKSFRGWLRTIAVNKWRDHLRRRAVAGRGGNDAGLAEVVVPDTVAPLWEKEFQQQIVGRALDLMQADFEPPTWKACWAQVVEGKAAPDVAKELGLSLAAVYAAKSRVLRRLRQELHGMLD
jgi:RNA polymerase sigma-70 factor (ECF subfamily)